MIFLVLLVLVLAGAAGAGLLGTGVFAGEGRPAGTGALAALAVPVVAVLGLAVLGLLVLGVGGGRDEGEAPVATPAPTASTLPSARLGPPAPSIPVLRIVPDADDTFSRYQPLTGLVPGGAVRVQADGFGWTEGGHVEQCVVELARQTACGELFPVFFDDGRADFQLAVRDDIAPGRCRAGQATCLVRLTSDTTRHQGSAQIVFVDRLTPGAVRVEPARGLKDGETVDVSVTGFPAGARATAVLCAPPAAYDARRCAAADQGSTFVTDAAGAGRTRLVVASGRLGLDQAQCGPRRPCGVQVLVGDGFLAAPIAPVTFSAGPGPSYDAGRVAAGVAVAVVLAGVAIGIAVRTDWAKPTEAATPDLDAADLQTSAGLDDLFGTEAELDERDPIPW